MAFVKAAEGDFAGGLVCAFGPVGLAALARLFLGSFVFLAGLLADRSGFGLGRIGAIS
jgi:hypothetical protein